MCHHHRGRYASASMFLSAEHRQVPGRPRGLAMAPIRRAAASARLPVTLPPGTAIPVGAVSPITDVGRVAQTGRRPLTPLQTTARLPSRSPLPPRILVMAVVAYA